jgi:hypothetical protein
MIVVLGNNFTSFSNSVGLMLYKNFISLIILLFIDTGILKSLCEVKSNLSILLSRIVISGGGRYKRVA